MPVIGRELRSTANSDGTLSLNLVDVTLDDPADDEIIVRVEAAPINPSDLGLLLGPADIASLQAGGTADRPDVTFSVPPGRMAAIKSRVGQSLAVGNEGAGTVIAAGTNAKVLEGKRVGMIGGGTLGSDIVQAMEQAAARNMTEFSRYGSNSFKQLYIYGALDLAPTTLNRLAFGFQWSVSGWLLTPFMTKAGAETMGRMRKRVVDELTTTFASHYSRVIGLAEALDPDVLRGYERKATGEKYLIDPTRG